MINAFAVSQYVKITISPLEIIAKITIIL